LTGKSQDYGGSAVRTEATGYGCVYFCKNMCQHHDDSLENKKIAISGSGNVARYAAEKAVQLGAKVISLSDSDGTIHASEGLTKEHVQFAHKLKEQDRGRVSEMAEKFDGITFKKDENPWKLECDIAMPCATQNELAADDAKSLVKNGVRYVCEGANMPTTSEAAEIFRESDVLHAPGKASNAGGVAVSGLEQSQNAMRLSWSREEIDKRLQDIMNDIHSRCVEHGEKDGKVNYPDGANIGGFRKVADAFLSYGVV
ncbi:MAG: glutamate dehydrogenase, partial [Planctomycetota bacterium]